MTKESKLTRFNAWVATKVFPCEEANRLARKEFNDALAAVKEKLEKFTELCDAIPDNRETKVVHVFTGFHPHDKRPRRHDKV